MSKINFNKFINPLIVFLHDFQGNTGVSANSLGHKV